MPNATIGAKVCLLTVLSFAVFFATNLGARTVSHDPGVRTATVADGPNVAPRSVAQTRTVNSTSDTDDGACDGAHCSLREAIKYAMAGDTINFSALFNTAQTIKLTGALPQITQNLTITGPGSALLEVRRDTGGNYPVFDIEGGAATVGISGLTVSNGIGGIFNVGGTVTLSHVVVTRNQQAPGAGGGIRSLGALNISDSVVSFNQRGGIDHYNAPLTVSRTLIFGNAANIISGHTVGGGGLDIGDATVTIVDSTIADNKGAGISYYNTSGSHNATLTNTTLSGNFGDPSDGYDKGSAVTVASFGGFAPALAMTNCTVAGNLGTAQAAVAAVIGSGGGTASIHLKNTILDDTALANLATSGAGASITSDGNNLANDGGGGFLVNVTDTINTDPMLAPLANYGGPTPSHLLRVGSPAIDAGNNTGAPAADQRGVTRPAGAHVDIGAVEMNRLLINSAGDPGDGVCDGTCALRDAIIAANAAGALTDIQFDTALFAPAQTINLASALPNLTGKMNLAGPGPDQLEVRRDSGGDYAVFDAEGGAQVSISGMTIANGAGTLAGGIANGASTMNLANLVVTGNQSSGSFGGGGIFNYNNATMSITDSVVSFNQTSAFAGGGISNRLASMTVSNTLITGNTANSGGGGIFNGSGQLDVMNSTIGDNTVAAGASAGGLYTDDHDARADVTLANTTLSGNSAAFSSSGAAILNVGNSIYSSNLTLAFCTLAGNAGSATAAVRTTSAGAGTSAHTELGNSIFSNAAMPNLGASGAGATVVSNGNNLASDGGSGLLNAGTDLLNTNPKLAPLGNYGGPTPTHLLLPGSPAIDAGSDSASPAYDQRGGWRAQGAHVDIGAVEVNRLLVTSAADPGDGVCDGTCTLRDAMLGAAAAGGKLVDVQFDASAFAAPQTINLASALPDITGFVDVYGPGARGLTVRRNTGGDYPVFTIDVGARASLSGLTVSNGSSPSGGGIRNAGSLTLARMAIDGNSAAAGGSGVGGGIYNAGRLTIDDSTISNNVGDDGGGLYNSAAFAHLTSTTISGNGSQHFTGGITNIIFGVGIIPPSILSLLNTTITNNAGDSSYEGGLYTGGNSVSRIKNTIIAANPPHNITGDNTTSIVSLGNNLADDNGAGFLSAAGDLTNVAPMLAPLAYIGGPTQTHGLQVGSPAIDAGSAAGAPLTDQRGYVRPPGMVDIGAIESDVLFRDGFEGL